MERKILNRKTQNQNVEAGCNLPVGILQNGSQLKLMNADILDSVNKKLPEQHRKKLEVDILLQNLKKLSQDDRVLLGLYFYEKLSVEEIATVLRWEMGQVKRSLDQIIPLLTSKQPATNEFEHSFTEFFG
jgi:DNA-directed RNA polymerase specialized sigma24 family protein